MDNLYLSICIPTFNRKYNLVKCIESIIYQKAFIDKQVEIVVQDDGSNDGTFEYMKAITQKYENINYIRIDETYNNDYNIRTTLSKGKGKFIKACNDSFKFLDGSLDYIVDLIKKYSTDKPHIYFANNNFSSAFESVLQFPEFIKRTSYKNTALITLGLWHEDIDEMCNITSQDDKYNWCCYANLMSAYKHENIVVVDKHMFQGTKLNLKRFNYPLFQVFHDNYIELLSTFLGKGISNDLLEQIEKDVLYFLLDWIIAFEMKDKHYVFLNPEDLKQKVFDTVKYKKYFAKYMCMYLLKKAKYCCKKMLKKT